LRTGGTVSEVVIQGVKRIRKSLLAKEKRFTHELLIMIKKFSHERKSVKQSSQLIKIRQTGFSLSKLVITWSKVYTDFTPISESRICHKASSAPGTPTPRRPQAGQAPHPGARRAVAAVAAAAGRPSGAVQHLSCVRRETCHIYIYYHIYTDTAYLYRRETSVLAKAAAPRRCCASRSSAVYAAAGGGEHAEE
jgi:hypothetical protein